MNDSARNRVSILLMLAVSACQSGSEAPATSSGPGTSTSVSATATAASSARPTAAPGSSQEAPGAGELATLAGYCEKICQRSATCGLEAAEAQAKSSADNAGAVAKAKTEVEATEKACVSECGTDKPGAGDEAVLNQAKACLQKADCAAFAQCLEAVAMP